MWLDSTRGSAGTFALGLCCIIRWRVKHTYSHWWSRQERHRNTLPVKTVQSAVCWILTLQTLVFTRFLLTFSPQSALRPDWRAKGYSANMHYLWFSCKFQPLYLSQHLMFLIIKFLACQHSQGSKKARKGPRFLWGKIEWYQQSDASLIKNMHLVRSKLPAGHLCPALLWCPPCWASTVPAL